MKRSCAKRNLRLKMKQSKRWLKGGAGAGTGASVATKDKGETDDAIYFISSSDYYNFLSNFAYCRFEEDGKTFISMEQYFMYQKAKLFDETQVDAILSITTDVDKHGLHFTAANADVELAKEQISKLTAAISSIKLTDAEAKLKEAEAKLKEAEAKLKEAEAKLKEAEAKLKEAQTKVINAKQPVSNPTEIDNNDVIILGKYAQLLGRQVKNYNDHRWVSQRVYHMCNGLRLKFTYNPELQRRLIATGNKTLYEANKFDDFWGIKFDIENAQKSENKSKYGKNMLGELLMVVRAELQSLQK
jgi:predicted NAD-dependent protein-ADP-ribosyltransferase YbiA (DUF1768 family)